MSKISELQELPYPLQATDPIAIVRGDTTYKGLFGDLFRGFLKFVAGYEGYLIIPADGNTDASIVQENDILIGVGSYFEGKYVIMRALQDSPTDDSEFKTGLKNGESL